MSWMRNEMLQTVKELHSTNLLSELENAKEALVGPEVSGMMKKMTQDDHRWLQQGSALFEWRNGSMAAAEHKLRFSKQYSKPAVLETQKKGTNFE
jgi:hypothetical protein